MMAEPQQQGGPQRPDVMREVAACTLGAAHRRDHDHGLTAPVCHPHAVEVVHLGDRAAMVCHDCRCDTGFVPHREAEHLAAEHRLLTCEGMASLTEVPGPRRAA